MSIKRNHQIALGFFILIQFLGGCLYAQTTLTGKVLDQKTKAPIPYASVYVENTFTGIATADDGSFLFEIDEKYQGDVIIRAMGYGTKVIPQSSFATTELDIYLFPSSFAIKEVQATANKVLNDPDQIVKNAIKSISFNMACDYTELEGLYHQAFQDYETDKLIDASQVKVKVGLQGIKTKHKTDSIWHDKPLSDNVFWESFRYNDDALLPQYQIPDYGTDHLQCLLRMDPVRNNKTPTFDFVKRLDKDFIDNHYLWLDSIGEYNGESVYFITVFLLNKIRFGQLNYLCGNYLIDEIKRHVWSSGKPALLYSGTTYLKSFQGYGATIPIGKIMITTNDFAFVYFEYTNGFGNDRYKFIAEYMKSKGKYYPSKIYFANKLRMNTTPDFTTIGHPETKYLKCLMGKTYYDDVIKRYSEKSEESCIVMNIIGEHSVNCPISGYVQDRKKVYVRRQLARTKIIEEIEDTFLYKDFHKLLHHRYVEFNLPDVDSAYIVRSHFNRYYYALGDRSFHWNVYLKRNGEKFLQHYNSYKRVTSAVNEQIIFSSLPIPVTSKDEHRYIIKEPTNWSIYDKPHLVKGLISIRGYRDLSK